MVASPCFGGVTCIGIARGNIENTPHFLLSHVGEDAIHRHLDGRDRLGVGVSLALRAEQGGQSLPRIAAGQQKCVFRRDGQRELEIFPQPRGGLGATQID